VFCKNFKLSQISDGIIALLFEPIIAIVSFFVFWIALRLISEVILSIFEMRISLKNKKI
jgi:hypothetical protein